MVGIVIGILILAAAATILVRRLVAFVRTRGRSACDHCPYAKGCHGGCRTKN